MADASRHRHALEGHHDLRPIQRQAQGHAERLGLREAGSSGWLRGRDRRALPREGVRLDRRGGPGEGGGGAAVTAVLVVAGFTLVGFVVGVEVGVRTTAARYRRRLGGYLRR